MEPDLKLFLAAFAGMYQFADVTSTNKAIRLGAGVESNGIVKKSMDLLNNFWWLIKVAPLWIAFWLVWDNPLGFLVVFVIGCAFYHWVVFGNNLPTIARWRARRAKRKS